FQVLDKGGGRYTNDQTILGTPWGMTTGGGLFRMDVASAGPDGSWPITITAVKARDCDGNVMPAIPGAPAALQVMNTPIPITPASLASGVAGVPYSQTLTAGSGTAPFTWAVTAGALPAGLTLSGAGLLSGTPTVIGTFNF